MPLPTIFDICMPRQDVLDHSFTEADFAADLAAVLREDGPEEYKNPAKFFARTYPTAGLKTLLRSVCSRLTGGTESIAPIFRLDTNYGGGKTHALIALAHAAKGMQGVPNASEFIDPGKLPAATVRVASFDGENADPFNGNPLEGDLRAYTPWGDIAYSLAGRAGYEKVRRSDEGGGAPGAGTIKELFGDEPTLILLDELSIYLRKLKSRDRERSGEQLTAFLTSLFKAVESSPRAAVVYTLAIGKGGLASDAYRQENMDIADAMAEAESVSARKATLLDPTEEDETVKVLQRRLFEQVDETRVEQVVEAYKQLWDHNKPLLPPVGATDTRVEDFRAGFPFHPELIAVLRNKTATLSNFQRVRGMLRILGRTVGRLWDERTTNTFAIHLHHIDPGFEPIRQEIVTRLGQAHLLPALRADVAAAEDDQPSLAEQLDSRHYGGLPPYSSMVARTIFFHTLAFNDQLKGASREEIRYSIIAPEHDISFIDDATTRFMQHSAYLDDRPNVPLRFQAEANLTQIIKRQEDNVDKTEVRVQLNDRIREIYGAKISNFSPIPFPGGPYDVPDDTSQGRPSLVIIGYDAADVSGQTLEIPDLVDRIYRHHGSAGDVRINRNNLVFLLADSDRKEPMRKKMVRHLALQDLLRPERLKELAEHQQNKMKEMARRSEQELALAIQQCYRHVLYPSKARVEGAKVDLAHAAIEVHTASQTPGDGQKHIIQVLRDCKKLRLPEDDPDSPSYVRDKTPLKKGSITTSALRREFFRDPGLPMLVGDEVFLRGLRQGIENGSYIYQSGDLIWAKGMPYAEIKIDENSMIYTSEYARENGIWPKPEPKTPPPYDQGSGPIVDVKGDTEKGPREVADTTRKPSPPPVGDVSAEGPLKEALSSLWEKARAGKMGKVKVLSLQLYDPSDGFKVMVLANGIPGATKQATITGGYETDADGELSLDFSGPIEDAQPIKDFLEPQLRAAREKDFKVAIAIEFNDGLDLSGPEPEKLNERLGKFGSGAAYVSASAKEGNV
jgi:hypothetical protein